MTAPSLRCCAAPPVSVGEQRPGRGLLSSPWTLVANGNPSPVVVADVVPGICEEKRNLVGEKCPEDGSHPAIAADGPAWQKHIRPKEEQPPAGYPIQGQQGPLPHRHRPRHVAHRFRRPLPAHDVHRQAHAGSRLDAVHRPRQPRLQGQTRRPDRRLPWLGGSAKTRAGDLHGKWRQRQPHILGSRPHHRHPAPASA